MQATSVGLEEHLGDTIEALGDSNGHLGTPQGDLLRYKCLVESLTETPWGTRLGFTKGDRQNNRRGRVA